MEPWQFFSQLRHIIHRDPGGRGLDRIAGRNLFTACAGDLEAACRSLADTREPIVAIVTVFDLMGETRRAFSRTFDYQTYLWAALLYLMIVEFLRNLWAWLEARLTRHLKR